MPAPTAMKKAEESQLVPEVAMQTQGEHESRPRTRAGSPQDV